MLPRFSAVADMFDKYFSDHFNKSLDEKLGPFLRDIPRQRQFEGAGWRLTTPERDSRKLFETFETSIKIKLDEVPRITVDELHRRVEEAAETFAKEMAQHCFASMDEAITEVGNVDSTPGPITPEKLLNVFEKVEMSFDDGAPKFTLVVPPGLEDAARAAQEQIGVDPALRARANEIFRKKWEEWRDRESDRVLD
jgi:hypothetical protein